MVDERKRNMINAYVEDREFEEPTYFFDNHAYDNSIIGITDDGILIYSYEKMNCDETDAIEWIEYNTMRALPYLGDRHPIIINEMDDIKERY